MQQDATRSGPVYRRKCRHLDLHHSVVLCATCQAAAQILIQLGSYIQPIPVAETETTVPIICAHHLFFVVTSSSSSSSSAFLLPSQVTNHRLSAKGDMAATR